MQAARSHMLESLEQRNDEQNALRKSSKAARAYARTYKTGPPLVPAFIVDKMLAYISKVSLRKKHSVVLSICKYWSLKREARRGAPLLKRLHLEVCCIVPPMRNVLTRQLAVAMDCDTDRQATNQRRSQTKTGSPRAYPR